MATVYAVHDLVHDRRVALKALHPELALLVGSARFLREIALAAQLQHPHILPIHDSGRADGLCWYTMPLVAGESLRQRLQREGPFGLEDALRLTVEIAEALDYAHRAGVVHRDIKPENILLSEGHALIADFGIARMIGDTDEAALTSTGLAVGTPLYMSPEQALAGQVDGRSDQYSLACLLYELLAGEPPHMGASARNVAAKRLLDPVPDVRRLRTNVPSGVATAVKRALAPVPGDRFPTMEAFARALTRDSAVEPDRRAWRVPDTRRAWVAVGAAAAVLVLSAVAWRVSHRGSADAPMGAVRLAVLPFTLTGDSARTYLADGLADAVRGKLAALATLEVVSSTGTDAYHADGPSIRRIGHELDVPYVLVGRIRWIGGDSGRLLVSSELIQTATGTTRWQSPMERSLRELPRVASDISLGVVSALHLALSPAMRGALTDTLTADPRAYDAYLRGREQFALAEKGPVSLEPARELFERAITLDTGFALAKVQLARVLHSTAGRDSTRAVRADSLLGAVLRSHPDLAEALVVRGDLWSSTGKADAGFRLVERAAELEPDNPFVLGRLIWLQTIRLDTAVLATARRAVAVAPRDADMLRTVVASTSIFRRFAETEAYADRMIALDPTDYMGYLNKALIQIWSRGDTAGAVRTLRDGERLGGVLTIPLAWGYAQAGSLGWQRWHRLRLADLSAFSPADTLDFYWYQAVIARAEGRERDVRLFADSIGRRSGSRQSFLPEWRATAQAELAFSYAVRGDSAKARDALGRADSLLNVSSAAGREQLRFYFVPALVELGMLERAVETARRLLEQPTGVTRRGLAHAPEFAGLRRLPAFTRLLADSRLP
jgi:serine/threonine-protein kinase